MIFRVPILLVLNYALFRMVEYYMLKYQQSVIPAVQTGVRTPMTTAIGFMLLPARIFGWVFLVLYGIRDGWLEPVKLLAMAFPLSLLLQMVPLILARRSFQHASYHTARIGIAFLPFSAALMFLLLPPH